jgi:hypothetical protein
LRRRRREKVGFFCLMSEINFSQTGISFLFSFPIIMTVLAAGEDNFDASNIGEAAEVVQEVVCDDELILIKG